MTVAEITSDRIAANDKAEQERQRQADRSAAIEALECVASDWQANVPALETAERQALARLERTRKAMAEAQTAADRAAAELRSRKFSLDQLRDSAVFIIEQTADPRWDAFIAELKAEAAEALENRFNLDPIVNLDEYGRSTLTTAMFQHNDRAKKRATAIQATIGKVRELKRDPHADAGVEIKKLRDALPTL